MHDPLADSNEAEQEYGIFLTSMEKLKPASAVVAAVAHRNYTEMPLSCLAGLMGKNPVIIDVKSIFDIKALDEAGMRVWRL